MTTGYFSLVQYCPDLAREEAVNAGVILFRPEPHFIDVRMAEDNGRIWQLLGGTPDGNGNWFLDRMKEAMQARIRIEADRFRTLADLEHFVSTRGNNLILTRPKFVRVEDPAADLQALFDDLVAAPAKGYAVGEGLTTEVVRETEQGGA